MLIEFSVANFLSIKERQTLRMDATGINDYPERVIDAGRHKLLRSTAIYGANASGKSNVLKAIETMSNIVLSSAERSSASLINVEPFLLNTETENKPCYFEAIFLINGIEYRYGFEVDRKVVKSEWLFETKRLKEKPLFLRESDAIDVARDFKEGKGLEQRTRDNALFLAVCDQFNGPLSEQIMQWFHRLLTVSGIDHNKLKRILHRLLDAPPIKISLTDILDKMSLGFVGINLEKNAIQDDFLSRLSDADQQHFYELLDGEHTIAVKTIHPKYNADNNAVDYVEFDLEKQESAGTNKFLDLLAPVYLSMYERSILIIDELDAKLHPLLTQTIIQFFNDPSLNLNNSQLIFATHDTNLLTYGQFRRDQIWFTEKDQYGATSLYSLVEYKEDDGTKVRKDRSFETDYIQGRYGAIPYIGDFSKLFQHGPSREN